MQKVFPPPPPPRRPCFSTDQNFRNTFWKGSPKEQSCEIVSNLTGGFREEKFWRISLQSTQCKKSSPPPPPRRPCFSTDQNFANNFWKWSHKEQYCKSIPNSDQRFQRRRFLKSFFKSTQYKKPPPSFPPPPPAPTAAMFFRRIKIWLTHF